MKSVPGLNPTMQKVLNHARQIIGEENGEPFTNLDFVLRSMKAHSVQKPELLKLLFEMYREASELDFDFRMTVLEHALAHKEEWGPRFAVAKAMGRPQPNVYPHPDDIVIRADSSVVFLGPITADEARRLKEMLSLRDTIFEITREIVAEAGNKYTVEEAEDLWKMMQRRYYRYVSKSIPKRHKQPFPRFEPDQVRI